MGTSPEAIGITATLFLPVLSVAARSVFLQPYSERSSDVWLKYCQANHVLRLLVVLLWCAFWEFRPFNNLPPSPFWVAPIIAVFVAQTSVRIISRRILERRWSSSDIARLAFWSTVSPSIALLMTASGFHSLLDREFVGLLWFPMAGAAAFIGMLRLQSAQGMKPRRVKSGTLLNRTLHLARRVGVRIDRVFIIPAGRGQLTNAFSVRGGVGLTDNFGEYLSGVELDSVIAHELGHAEGRHTLKEFTAVMLVVLFFSVLSFGIPSAGQVLRAGYVLFALLTILLFYYHVSRKFEYECDRKAVEYTNSPEGLIRGLAALYEKTGAPIACARVVELFMTHPSLIHRVEAVAQRAKISRAQLFQLLPQLVDVKPKTTAAAP